MAGFTVARGRLVIDGRIAGPGERVNLTDEQASRLLAAGLVEPARRSRAKRSAWTEPADEATDTEATDTDATDDADGGDKE